MMQLSDRIGRRLKLHDLHVLMTVAQAASMSKAAALLNTTQSAVSRTIADLELTIGARLLDRGPHGVDLTDYGRVLLKHGVIVFDELRQGIKNIEFLSDPAAGEAWIGTIDPLAGSFVSTVVERLHRRYPRITSHVVSANSEVLHHELSERNVDFLIARRWGPLFDERLNFDLLFDDSFFVVAGAHSPWVRRRRIALSDLMTEPWTLPPPEGVFGSTFRQAFRASGLDYPRVAMSTLHVEARINLLMTGRFLSIFSTSGLTFSPRRSELKVLPVELQIAPVPVGVVTLKNRTLNPVAQLFIEHAREAAKPLTKKNA